MVYYDAYEYRYSSRVRSIVPRSLCKLLFPLWSRTGGDRGNCSQSPLPGPRQGYIWRRIPLTNGSLSAEHGTFPRLAGGAVAADSSLRVAFRGMVYAFSAEGMLRWSHDLSDAVIVPEGWNDADPDSQEELLDEEATVEPYVLAYHSLPTLIDTDTIITCSNTALRFDHTGRLIKCIEASLVDDSGLAPNYDCYGTPILTSIGDGVSRWEGDTLHTLGFFGYDIPPVAVFADNSLAIAGYARKGLCRVTQNGQIVWQTTITDADIVPTINRQQYTAVGSLNDARSFFVTPEGTIVADYPAAATFAVTHDDGWIALTHNHVACLSLTGTVRWSSPTDTPQWYRHQPIIDREGRIYITERQHITALTMAGDKLFSLPVDHYPGPLFPTSPNSMATVIGDDLIFLR